MLTAAFYFFFNTRMFVILT